LKVYGLSERENCLKKVYKLPTSASVFFSSEKSNFGKFSIWKVRLKNLIVGKKSAVLLS
jgi:hypothetical protein